MELLTLMLLFISIKIGLSTYQRNTFWDPLNKPVCACIGAKQGTVVTLRRYNDETSAFIGQYTYTIASTSGVECLVLAETYARTVINNRTIDIVLSPAFISTEWITLNLLDFDMILYNRECSPYVVMDNFPKSQFSAGYSVYNFPCSTFNNATLSTALWGNPLYSNAAYKDVYANISMLPILMMRFTPIDFLLKNCTYQTFLLSTDGSIEYYTGATSRFNDFVIDCTSVVPSSSVYPTLRVAQSTVIAPKKMMNMPANACTSIPVASTTSTTTIMPTTTLTTTRATCPPCATCATCPTCPTCAVCPTCPTTTANTPCPTIPTTTTVVTTTTRAPCPTLATCPSCPTCPSNATSATTCSPCPTCATTTVAASTTTCPPCPTQIITTREPCPTITFETCAPCSTTSSNMTECSFSTTTTRVETTEVNICDCDFPSSPRNDGGIRTPFVLLQLFILFICCL